MLLTLLLWMAYALIGIAICSYYVILYRLSRIGYPVRFFASGAYGFRTIRAYRLAARQQHTSILPVNLFYICSISGFILFFCAFIFSRGELPTWTTASASGGKYESVPFVVSMVLTLIFALIFSWRLVRKVAQDPTGNFSWTRMLLEPGLRSDLFGAILSWSAVVFLLIAGPKFFSG